MTSSSGVSTTPVLSPSVKTASVVNATAAVEIDGVEKKEKADAKSAPAVKTPVLNYRDPVIVEMKVREYFSDTPILTSVAWCESRFTHFNSDGTVLRGMVTPEDRGVMQINEFYHLEDSKKLGFNIYTLEGNLAYAKYLYDKYGLEPWSASDPCLRNIAAI